jgi:hypothetical protein
MKVGIKTFDVQMDVKNNGIEFQVYDNQDKFLGDFFVTKTGVIWCKGRTKKANGRKVNWAQFITYMEADHN